MNLWHEMPPAEVAPARLEKMLCHDGTRIILDHVGHVLQAMCSLHVLPNMPRSGQSYGLIANVATPAA